MELSAEALVTHTASAVARERGRCRAIVDNAADLQIAQGNVDAASALYEIAELIAGGSDLYGNEARDNRDDDVQNSDLRESDESERPFDSRSKRPAERHEAVSTGEEVGERQGSAVEEGERRQREDVEEAEWQQALRLRQWRD